MENASPIIVESTAPRVSLVLEDGKLRDVCPQTIFEVLRHIKDPEHPYTLEQLGVVSLDDILVEDLNAYDVLCTKGLPIPSISVIFTPTVPHCSLAGIIGLCILYNLEKYTKGYWIRVSIKEETHSNYLILNRQFSDRDRVMAAFENQDLMAVVGECISGTLINS